MTIEVIASDFLPRVSRLIFFSIEITLYAILLIKILGVKLLKKLKFNAAGQLYNFAALSFLIYAILNVLSVVNGDKVNILSTVKTFVYLMSLVFILLHFYKVASFNTFGNSITKAKIRYKAGKSIKRATYLSCASIVYIQTISVAIFSNSGSYLKYSDIIPVFALIIFNIYLFYFIKKVDTGKTYVMPWILSTVAFIIFLVIRFFLDNLIFNNQITFFILSLVSRTVNIFFYGYVALSKKDLELIYD